MKREKELAEVVVKEWSPAETMMTVGGGRGERFFKIQLIVMKVKRKKKKKKMMARVAWHAGQYVGRGRGVK